MWARAGAPAWAPRDEAGWQGRDLDAAAAVATALVARAVVCCVAVCAVGRTVPRPPAAELDSARVRRDASLDCCRAASSTSRNSA